MSQTIPGSRPDRSHIAPVKTREELIYLLSRAAELEHGLACIYLFAAYSLKNDVSEGGITDKQISFDAMRQRVLGLQSSMQTSFEEEERDNEGCEPFEIDFKSVGEFYHKIETGFDTIRAREGELHTCGELSPADSREVLLLSLSGGQEHE